MGSARPINLPHWSSWKVEWTHGCHYHPCSFQVLHYGVSLSIFLPLKMELFRTVRMYECWSEGMSAFSTVLRVVRCYVFVSESLHTFIALKYIKQIILAVIESSRFWVCALRQEYNNLSLWFFLKVSSAVNVNTPPCILWIMHVLILIYSSGRLVAFNGYSIPVQTRQWFNKSCCNHIS